MSGEIEGNEAQQERTSSGIRGMFSAMMTMMAIWLDPGMVEEDRIPPRFITATLVLWTVTAICLSAAVSGVQILFSGKPSLLSLVVALTMFLAVGDGVFR